MFMYESLSIPAISTVQDSFGALFLPIQQIVLRMSYIMQHPYLYKIYRMLIVKQFCLKIPILRGLVLSLVDIYIRFFETF